MDGVEYLNVYCAACRRWFNIESFESPERFLRGHLLRECRSIHDGPEAA